MLRSLVGSEMCIRDSSGTVGKDRGEPCPARHLDGLDGLGQGAYLVHLDEDGVGSLLLDAPGKVGAVRHVEVVAHDLDLATHALHELLPAVPVLSLIHISEPTRLLSISYAVFCLKKKKNRYITIALH